MRFEFFDVEGLRLDEEDFAFEKDDVDGAFRKAQGQTQVQKSFEENVPEK